MPLSFSPESIQSLIALALGFSVGGMLASAYQLVTARPVTFGLLEKGPSAKALAAVPLLCFAAPFIIMRNTLRGIRTERRGFHFTFFTTLFAGLWSLMSGHVVVMALAAAGLFI
jgi:hypothetical protein